MHKLMEYICDELEELDRKVEKEGKLSSTEIQYADLLAHTKKNLLKAEEMSEGGEYSSMGSYSRTDGRSYARGRGRNARRDSMGRYSSEGRYSGEGGYSRAEDFHMEFEELMQKAPNDRVRQKMMDVMRDM